MSLLGILDITFSHVSWRRNIPSPVGWDLGHLPLNYPNRIPKKKNIPYPTGSIACMLYIYIYANIWGILMVNVTIYSIHGSYGYNQPALAWVQRLSQNRLAVVRQKPELELHRHLQVASPFLPVHRGSTCLKDPEHYPDAPCIYLHMCYFWGKCR